MNLTETCVKKPVFAWMLMAATIVFGLVAATRIGISQYPDVDFPTISVSATWEGAAPEVMKTMLWRFRRGPRSGGGSKRSPRSPGREAPRSPWSSIAKNVDLALQDVQTKASGPAPSPKDIDPHRCQVNPEDSPFLARWPALPQPRLSDPSQVSAEERRFRPSQVRSHREGWALRTARLSRLERATVSDIIRLPEGHGASANLETPGREINVRVLGEAIDLETLRNIVVREVNETPIYLKDVALVEDGFEDVRRFTRVDGAPAQGLGIKKQRGANAVAVAQSIRSALKEFEKTLPPGMTININFDSTKYIEDSVNEIKMELILSVVLTALVCWMFLGSLSSTLNVILAIPMSLLGTVAIIYFLGFTFNTFTLLAMALAVGIVVDDAIMVMENIFRHAEGGKPLVQSALEGTHEIKFAAFAATLAVVAIFLPVVFMKGIIGKFFLQFGITLCLAVLLSYLRLSPWPSGVPTSVDLSKQPKPCRAICRRELLEVGVFYGKVLKKTLKRPKQILAGTLLIFLLAIGVFYILPGEFVPSQDQSLILIRLQTAVGSDIGETDKLLQQAESFIRSQPEVKTLFVFLGGGGGGGVNGGTCSSLWSPKDRKASQAEFSALLRKNLTPCRESRGHSRPIPGRVHGPEGLSRGVLRPRLRLGPVDQHQPRYHEQACFQRLSRRLGHRLQARMPELRVEPDRKRVSDIGVSIDDVATTLNSS